MFVPFVDCHLNSFFMPKNSEHYFSWYLIGLEYIQPQRSRELPRHGLLFDLKFRIVQPCFINNDESFLRTIIKSLNMLQTWHDSIHSILFLFGIQAFRQFLGNSCMHLFVNHQNQRLSLISLVFQQFVDRLKLS